MSGFSNISGGGRRIRKNINKKRKTNKRRRNNKRRKTNRNFIGGTNLDDLKNCEKFCRNRYSDDPHELRNCLADCREKY